MVGMILDSEYISNADLNNDGNVDLLDIITLVNLILYEE